MNKAETRRPISALFGLDFELWGQCSHYMTMLEMQQRLIKEQAR